MNVPQAVVSLIAAAAFAGAQVTWAGEGDLSISAPFPKSQVDQCATTSYCDATVGTELWASAEGSPIVRSKGEAPGLRAIARHDSDRLVVQIDGKSLYMSARSDFEAGKASRDVPMPIVENSARHVIATVVGPIASGVTTFTIDRQAGLATWTTIYSHYPISDTPRVDSMFMTCGARRD